MSLFDSNVVRVSRFEAKKFYDDNHYLGGCGSSWSNYAKIQNGEIVACVSFGVPASPNLQAAWFEKPLSSHVYELTRLAIKSPIMASSFVSQSIRLWLQYRRKYKQKSVYALVSYADTSAGHHGGVYQAMSWIYCGLTRGSIGYLDEEGRIIHRRSNGQNINQREANVLKLRRIKTGDKHRYVKLLGSKSMKKTMLKSLKYKMENYPKPYREVK